MGIEKIIITPRSEKELIEAKEKSNYRAIPLIVKVGYQGKSYQAVLGDAWIICEHLKLTIKDWLLIQDNSERVLEIILDRKNRRYTPELGLCPDLDKTEINLYGPRTKGYVRRYNRLKETGIWKD